MMTIPDHFCLTAQQVFTAYGMEENVFIHINNGLIETIDARPKAGYQVMDFGNKKILPGLIDLHIHGRCGVDVMDATSETLEDLVFGVGKSWSCWFSWHYGHGTTGKNLCCPFKYSTVYSLHKNVYWCGITGQLSRRPVFHTRA